MSGERVQSVLFRLRQYTILLFAFWLSLRAMTSADDKQAGNELSVRSPLYNSTHLYNLCLVRWEARVRGAHRPFLEDLSQQLVGR